MKPRAWIFAIVLVAAFVALSSRAYWMPESWRGPSIGERSPLYTPSARGAGLSSEELNNIDVYKSSRQATVNITSTVYKRYFFDVVPSSDIGSGFLINAEGVILTNAHVLQGSSKLQVTMSDQTVYPAQILDADRTNDLALIKIVPKKKLTFLHLGDSDAIQVGQKVLAIGNPFGLEGTLTTGIISSLGRNIRDEQNGELEGLIQTDAAINPGNSGGPLLDSQGNVIGINTAIYGKSGNIGIGFAMPINRAKAMLDSYRTGKRFVRPRLGVGVVYVAGDLAAALQLPEEGGLLVQEVRPGTPAAAAGLRGGSQTVIVGNVQLVIGGDLILAIDGQQVTRDDAITRSLSRKKAGDRMTLSLYRNGRVVKVEVQLTEAAGV